MLFYSKLFYFTLLARASRSCTQSFEIDFDAFTSGTLALAGSDAMANPTVGGGNEIVRALICLLFCGIALVIALQMILKQKPQENKFPAALLL
ncbi:MAG: hypothetical protein EOO47_17700 [Flavobacterium sp.]|nr:MAG: hypothetical protein EOO47_17700 [Flavobacterium sp.]